MKTLYFIAVLGLLMTSVSFEASAGLKTGGAYQQSCAVKHPGYPYGPSGGWCYSSTWKRVAY